MSEFVRAARIGDVVAGKGFAVKVDGIAVALFSIDGQILAVEDRCSHMEARLVDGWVEGCVVECAVHGGRFDLRTGAPLGYPAVAPIRTFPVRVENGEISVKVR